MALCPICRKKDATPEYKPFCSKRCADIDLGRWFNGGYAIQTEEPAPVGEGIPDAANDE